MFGSQILEVAIGIVFIFILISIICSAIREGIEAWIKTRAAFLEYGVRELLHDKNAEGIARNFYNHPLIFSLFSEEYKPGSALKRPSAFTNGSALPSYIPARNFALALMDIAARGPETDAVSTDSYSPNITVESIRMNIENIKNYAVQRVMLTALDSAQGDLNKVQADIEAWYNSGMDRVSGWYKRSTQWVIFWIGLFAAVSLNINTITIGDYLYRNGPTRAVIVAKAEAASKDPNYLNRNYDVAINELNTMGLPIGWQIGWGAPRQSDDVNKWDLWNNVFGPILGWLLTAIAATMGAPFWFDLLNKMMVIRSTVKPHEKSLEEASEDRQMPTFRSAQPKGDKGLQQRNEGTGKIGNENHTFREGENLPTTRDEESSLDGCDVDAIELTADKDLPKAEGGIA